MLEKRRKSESFKLITEILRILILTDFNGVGRETCFSYIVNQKVNLLFLFSDFSTQQMVSVVLNQTLKFITCFEIRYQLILSHISKMSINQIRMIILSAKIEPNNCVFNPIQIQFLSFKDKFALILIDFKMRSSN